ncbi:6-hydroxymethylpterin diphosphokinase MptE-like protein [Microbulbifer sp. SAOS-129_SWC]|uniref:6-hydroxymethylpterin diphosphokinase MptE-like protein n=1 Tax=Microbulbifer sp. SAOS-129_SWC TaxID=3145235 RepID=UPI0032176FD6
MLSKDPGASYYEFWLNHLESRIGSSSRRFDTSTGNRLQFSLKHRIKECFKEFDYIISAEQALSEDEAGLRNEKDRLVKSFPFNGDIYLPTNKISLSNQVSGLRKVADLVGEKNREVSRNRFDSLKQLIQRTGKKRIFVLGNGPSLKKTDLDLLKDEITIGFNGIFLHETFTPTIHIVEDHLVAEDRAEEITGFDCPVKIFPSYLGYCLPVQENTIFLNHLPRKSFPVDTDFSANAGEISYTGGTVTYTGLQVAASLGFEEIYLLGVDASYKVENVDRTTDYGTGVLCSKGDDVNHFDTRYFGAGYRWHDPNVHTMLQAYRKARMYAERNNIRICNATIGGELEVFPRADFYQLFPVGQAYPKTAIIDFTHVNWLCATGIVKKNLFEGWPGHSSFNIHSRNPNCLSAFHKTDYDCYAQGSDNEGILAALRSLIEYSPKVMYMRPTHDRPALTIFQLLIPYLLNVPFTVHYMDDWVEKLKLTKDVETSELYRGVMQFFFNKASRVFTISQKMSDFLATKYAVPVEKLQVVHNYTSEGFRHYSVIPADKKTVRYFGGLEEDMSLDSVLLLAKSIEKMNNDLGSKVHFEIFTGSGHLEKFGPLFDGFKYTILTPQVDNYDVYLSLLSSSDVNALCYNFDGASEVYLRYSMANKLPEIIGANKPFIAIGSSEIGTITFLKEQEFPSVVSEKDENSIVNCLTSLLFEGGGSEEAYLAALDEVKDEFSAERNLYKFQGALRSVSESSLAPLSKDEMDSVLEMSSKLFSELGPHKEKYVDLLLLTFLFSRNELDLSNLVNRIATHGVAWQFKETEKDVKSALKAIDGDAEMISEEIVNVLAYFVVSLGNRRFSDVTEAARVILKNNGLMWS